MTDFSRLIEEYEKKNTPKPKKDYTAYFLWTIAAVVIIVKLYYFDL